MRMARFSPHLWATLLIVGACAGGDPSLEYGLPDSRDVRYDYADTTRLELRVMGQRMDVRQEGTAEYAVSFAPAPDGVAVTLTVAELQASLRQPLGGPVRLEEDAIEGVLVFSLDRQGNAVVTEQPEIDPEATAMISGLVLAHSFFPGLPGRPVSAGDVWHDTLTFEGSEGGARRSERSVLRYEARGDTAAMGRTLLVIDVTGTTEAAAEVPLGGMTARVTTELEVDGQILWDSGAGLMAASRRLSTGSGRISVPVVPNPIPVSIRSRQSARIRIP